ncbi:hypothetical protein V8C34DRAFT_313398 [Trichoderma compactum]
MPNAPRLTCRTIPVEPGQLPAPATKLVITQVLQASQDSQFWALITVGAFYDSEDRIIWSTEQFAAHVGTDSESDDEEASEAEAETGRESEAEPEAGAEAEATFESATGSTIEPSSPPVHSLAIHQPVSPIFRARHPEPYWQHPISAYRGYNNHESASSPSRDMSGGWNPLTGRDSGSGRPAFAPYGAPQPAQGQAYIPHAGGPGYSFGTAPQHSAWPNMTYGYYPLATSQGVPQFVVPGAGYPHAQGPTAGYYAQQTYSYQPNGTGNMLPRQPQPYPNIDPTMPAAQMTNTTGGTGCEPGYNYFFPAEHTKAHVFKTNTPPWQLPPTAQIPFKAAHIPCNTTMAELLKGFGCTNATPKKNKCFEVVSGGGGKWYKGLEVNGADKDMLKKTIKDVGWDSTRTGNPNEKPVVCLWFCRD